MVALLIAGGIFGAFVLAIIGSTQAESAAASATPSEDTTQVPDAINTAIPDNISADENIESTAVSDWRKTGITTDENTWPSGDAIWDICRAIAKAEGYNTNGAAFRLNNPGDISDGVKIYGAEWHDGSNITKFPDAATGWNWLYNKIHNHINGNSKVFPASWTITQFSQKYAGNWQNWKTNVGRELQVNPDESSFAEYVGV